jgi:hypothetical protein
MTDAGWRGQCPVLVPDAQAMGSVAVIRSLGRAGYPVHACASRPDALGLRSRYATASIVCPSYDAPGFAGWLERYVARHRVRAIVPSEGLLLALRPAFDRWRALLPCGPDEATVYRGMAKCDVFDALAAEAPASVARHLPPSLILEAGKPLPDASRLAALGRPLYLKVDAAAAGDGGDGAVHRVATAGAARECAAALLARYQRVLVQGHVPGRGAGAFFLLWDGRVLAEFMHLRLHEVPHTGGVSSLRRSWCHAGIRDDALAKLRHLGWRGVAMMEYRWDPATDRYHFLEMNGRFWGSLHLALHAGVDFPRLLLDAFLGRPSPPVTGYAVGLRCRWTFPKEAQYVWSRLRDPALPWRARLWPALEFGLLALDPRTRSDLLFPGDRALFWRSLARFVRSGG